MSNRLFTNPEKTASDLFAKHEARMDRRVNTVERLFKFGFIAWCVWAVFCLCALGGLVYAAIHFITKYW
jgi:hypothetical protein